MARWHESRVRVRFYETDAMGVVYYSNFFTWMQDGVGGLLRDVGLSLAALAKKGLVAIEAHADYRDFVHFDEEVLIRTKVAGVTERSVRFQNEILRMPDRKLVCTGYTIHAFRGDGERELPFPIGIRRRLMEIRVPADSKGPTAQVPRK